MSFYLNEAITIRNKDWNSLSKFFNIPQPVCTIDFDKTLLKEKNLIPEEKQVKYHLDVSSMNHKL